MADLTELHLHGQAQASGNPVLDSKVNIIRAIAPGRAGMSNLKNLIPLIQGVHAALFEIAEQEPGGLKGLTT